MIRKIVSNSVFNKTVIASCGVGTLGGVALIVLVALNILGPMSQFGYFSTLIAGGGLSAASCGVAIAAVIFSCRNHRKHKNNKELDQPIHSRNSIDIKVVSEGSLDPIQKEESIAILPYVYYFNSFLKTQLSSKDKPDMEINTLGLVLFIEDIIDGDKLNQEKLDSMKKTLDAVIEQIRKNGDYYFYIHIAHRKEEVLDLGGGYNVHKCVIPLRNMLYDNPHVLKWNFLHCKTAGLSELYLDINEQKKYQTILEQESLPKYPNTTEELIQGIQQCNSHSPITLKKTTDTLNVKNTTTHNGFLIQHIPLLKST